MINNISIHNFKSLKNFRSNSNGLMSILVWAK
ncbi:Uncharacterised protein [Pantoea agglomerans]|uniref:Uncharacterized protein n=1 Tax=Enterobacter agglomerans TaxID=549 RepID=A0A379ADA6_ENTAG|nr:Uncharacterised protein [Pantoea agglomerans]